MTRAHSLTASAIALVGVGLVIHAQAPVSDPNRKFLELAEFRFEAGGVLPRARVAYATFGALNAARDNAVLLATCTAPTTTSTTSWSAREGVRSVALLHRDDRDVRQRRVLLAEQHAGAACGAGLSRDRDPRQRRGLPSRARPPWGDACARGRRLLDGCRAIIPVGRVPSRIYGRDYPVVRHGPDVSARRGAAQSAIAALTTDPAFAGGRYTSPPVRGLAAWSAHWAAWVWSQEWWRRELYKPQSATVADVLAARTARDATRDANNLIAQARAWQRHDVGSTPGLGGDVAKALGSIRARVLYMPCETDLYFPIGDAKYESQFLKDVSFVPIPSLWGHSAGGGGNPDDATFINEQIARFLRH